MGLGLGLGLEFGFGLGLQFGFGLGLGPVAEERLGRHYNERLAELTDHLAVLGVELGVGAVWHVGVGVGVEVWAGSGLGGLGGLGLE